MRPVHIEAGKVLVDGVLEDTSVTVSDGVIAAFGAPCPDDALRIDGRDLCVLPGIVDVHGDAFERQIMPRPGVHIDLSVALAETDRQLAANGITTAYHGLTLSWEPGLRSADAGRAFMDALAAARPGLGVDHRVQLRWETFAFEAIDLVAAWLQWEPRPALAFNDHTTMTADKLEDDSHAKLSEWARRAGLSEAGYRAFFEEVWSRKADVPRAIADMAQRARTAGVVMLSHDDRTREDRALFRSLGAPVAEFPMTGEAVAEARLRDEHTVFGAPNVLRGGSHNGALDAGDMVAAGLCTVLASDYYYPAMTGAMAQLARRIGLPLESTWSLISKAPAEAMQLADRGRIEVGLRGDLVLARIDAETGIRVDATLCGGRLVYISGHERIAR